MAKVCAAVQVLALPTFSEATTAPVVGEIVKVPSAFVTEVTAPKPLQLPFVCKQIVSDEPALAGTAKLKVVAAVTLVASKANCFEAVAAF